MKYIDLSLDLRGFECGNVSHLQMKSRQKLVDQHCFTIIEVKANICGRVTRAQEYYLTMDPPFQSMNSWSDSVFEL